MMESEVYLYRGEGRVRRNAVRIEVHRSVTVIPDYLFADFDLESLLLHDGLLKIGRGAFLDCISLRSFQCPSTVEEIGAGAFQGCSNLAAVRCPSAVAEIGAGAFQGCSNLAAVDFPEGPREGLLKIGESAFRRCSSLRIFRCPSNVTEIGAEAFMECSNLAEVKLPEGLESIMDWTFHECTSLEEIRIPASVARIGHNAFCHCTNLSLVELREGLRTVGDSAFQYCASLGNLRVPPSVVEIGSAAFQRCDNLSWVQLNEDLPMMTQSPFRHCPLGRFHFARLSERMEVIGMDNQTNSMFESRLREMTLAITRADHDDREEATAFQEKCKRSLGRAHEALTYLELKGAAPVVELALWKAKIEGDRGMLLQVDHTDDEDGGRDPSSAVMGPMPLAREGERCEAIENIDRDPRPSRGDCRVKCGADVVIPEVLRFFAYSPSWPRFNGGA